MNVVSLKFIAFLIVTTIAYFAMRKSKAQQWVLTIASIFFYVTYSLWAYFYMLFVSLLVFVGAKRIENIAAQTKEQASAEGLSKEEKQQIKASGAAARKTIKLIAVIIIMGIWTGAKVAASATALGLILPLGISFFSFTAVGYLIDVNRGKYSAETDFGKFVLFITYFPHIVQGPFSRYDELSPSLFEEHRFDFDRLSRGTRRMLWGFAKKAVIADQLAVCVNKVVTGYTDFAGSVIVCSILLYGIQLYADFSGYMDIMCGFSEILGIKLQENFRQPYFAGSVDEFWRRWHMSLGTWCKDYVFYPISLGPRAQKIGKWARGKFGPRMGKLAPSYYAMIFVWTFTGFWHGANWNQVIWGWLNLIIIVIGMQIGDDKLPRWLQIVRTYILISIIRCFSIPSSLDVSMGIIKQIITNFDLSFLIHYPTYMFIGLEMRQIVSVVLGIIALTTVDVLAETGRWEAVRDKSVILKNIAAVLLIFAIVLFAGTGGDLSAGFMYANF